MKIARLFAAIVAVTLLAGQPAAAQTKPAKPTAKANWTATVALLPDGTHVLGNPAAKVRVDEFVSYTCSHCASFQREAEAPIRLAYVMPGKVSVRVVHVVRDPVDLTVAMLTHCGDTKGFFARHHDFLSRQAVWIAQANRTSEAQRARWSSGTVPTRMRAIAADLDLYTIASRRGINRAAADRCLADTAKATALASQRGEAERIGISGTPGFAIGGVLVEDVHDWAGLKAAIDAKL